VTDGAAIRSRFLPRFLTIAEGRLQRCTQLAERGDWNGITSELHALAGEAALLELRDIANLAREGERLARKPDSQGECASVLRAIEAQIAACSTGSGAA
jgi:HPt (histidine-containing phosphotransfer) domain-containing protein